MDVAAKGGEVVGEVEIIALRGVIASVAILERILAARRAVVVAARSGREPQPEGGSSSMVSACIPRSIDGRRAVRADGLHNERAKPGAEVGKEGVSERKIARQGLKGHPIRRRVEGLGNSAGRDGTRLERVFEGAHAVRRD